MSHTKRCDWSDLPVHECAHCQPAGTHPATEAERADAIVTRLQRGEARTVHQATKSTALDLDAWVSDIGLSDHKRLNGGNEA